MGLVRFTLNVTLDGCYDHRETIADDELHDDTACSTRSLNERTGALSRSS
jgi:hypothetical protein